MATTVAVVRVYQDGGRAQGDYRVLVDRLWPRGLVKTTLDHDEWNREVAPSTELRRWYGHLPERFAEFSERYEAELAISPAADGVNRLAVVARSQHLVLLTATRDVERSAAAVLRGVIQSLTD